MRRLARATRARIAAMGLCLAVALGAQETENGAREGRQRVDSGDVAGLSIGVDAAAAPAQDGLRLDPAVRVGLRSGAFSAEARLPFIALLGSGGLSAVPGDIGLSAELAGAFRGLRLRVGASIAAPTGRALPDGCGPGAGSAFWNVAASLEAARVLDPAAVAVQFVAGLCIPRPGIASRAAPQVGLCLSFAQALNAAISLGLSASLGAAFTRGSEGAAPEYSGGSGIAVMWGGDALSYRAGLSGGLGDGGGSGSGPVLGLGIERFCARGGGHDER